MNKSPESIPLLQRNKKIMIWLVVGVMFMIGLSFASVPLYDLFCRVTGYGGTTQRADSETLEQTAQSIPKEISTRKFTIRFDTNVATDLNWEFLPPKESIVIGFGDIAKASYYSKNLDNKETHGIATYNVTPNKAGLYFVKTQCFCFEEQTLKVGESVDMPVLFYMDPAILEDKNLDDVNTITLSYTFFAK